MIEIRQPFKNELGKARALRDQELKGNPPTANQFEPTEDDLSPLAIHMAAFDSEEVVATVRADAHPDDNSVYFISRMATSSEYRKRGIGMGVLLAIENEAKARGAKGFVLTSRPDATGFYKKAGYWNTHLERTGDIVMTKLVTT